MLRDTAAYRSLKRVVPAKVRGLPARYRAARERRQFRDLDVPQTFERIYAEKWWGGEADFDSGEGSVDPMSDRYVKTVREFITSRDVRSVADLGCGDFRVGSKLLGDGVDYVGVDVVPTLIERNRARFAERPVRFEIRNLISDELPPAELGLLRQVLQHLSNAEIEQLLANAAQYRYLIVTEHLPVGRGVRPNIDKPHGPDIRLPERSGVFLDQPPFSVPTETLLEVDYAEGQILRTVLIDRSGSDPG